MDDQKSNHNLLQLQPPSSSSSPIFNHLNSTSTPPEVAEFLGFYNLQPTSCSNNPYHALQTPSSEPNEQLVPTSFSLMSHNTPYMMSTEIGYGALEESAGMSESPGGVGLIDDPCQVIDSSRMMGRKRRAMNNAKGKVMESPTDVIHVRAKRGQATDSHSLAERVRRERINEKMRVLQDLVPGCYKTMGTAVMFDVIIKYVQSLQHQIEFLSMKLSAASMFYDFSSPEAEAVEALQQRGNPCEARDMEEMMMMRDEGCEGINASSSASADQSFHSTWPF